MGGVGTERRENWRVSPTPGGWRGTPGVSSSTSATLAAVVLSIASSPITVAVPSSPSARLMASAVTVISSISSARVASSIRRLTCIPGTRLRGTRAVA